MHKKNIITLVTGGAGFIGSNLVDALVDEGYKVRVIDNLIAGKKEYVNPAADFYKLDVRNLEKIGPLFKDVDYVFHLAALPRVSLSVEKPDLTNDVNINGTLNVLIAARDAKVKRVVYSASSSAYGNQKTMPLKEIMPVNPLSPYGLQKYVGELYCRLFSELYNLETVSLRYFNVYGQRQSEEGAYALLIAKFLKQKREGGLLTITWDGRQTRDFTYVGDVANANILAMKSKKVGKGEVINIGAGNNYSVNEIAKIIGGRVKYIPKRPGEPRHTLADISLAKKLLDWKPKGNLEAEIRKMVKEI